MFEPMYSGQSDSESSRNFDWIKHLRFEISSLASGENRKRIGIKVQTFFNF